MNRQTVLILARDPAFSREVKANWPQDPYRDGPEFIVLDQECSVDLEGSHYDLAVADASSAEKLKRQPNSGKRKIQNKPKDLKQSLAAAGKPAIVIHSDGVRGFYHLHGSVLELRRQPGIWALVAGLIGSEILRRCRAESRAAEAEKLCAAAHAEATLGRYMVEMRTNVNNALTTVLGNAELLVHEPGLPATIAAQADALRNMALRLHEVFQRFSSLEKELIVAARESNKNSAAAGS